MRMKLYLVVVLTYFSIMTILHAQALQENQKFQELEKRLQSLEARMISLEDFCQQQFNKILIESSGNNSMLEQQKIMSESLEKMQEQLQTAQAEILRLKISLASFQKGGTESSQETGKNISIDENKIDSTNVSPIVRTYQNPDVAKYAKQLQSPESSIRIGAVLQLNKIEDTEKSNEATQALLSALSDKDVYVKMLAIKSLGKRKNQSTLVIPSLLTIMLDSQKDVRAVAAKAIQEITGSSEVFLYEASLEDRKKAIQVWQKKYKK